MISDIAAKPEEIIIFVYKYVFFDHAISDKGHLIPKLKRPLPLPVFAEISFFIIDKRFISRREEP